MLELLTYYSGKPGSQVNLTKSFRPANKKLRLCLKRQIKQQKAKRLIMQPLGFLLFVARLI